MFGSICNGTLVPIEEVADAVFSEKMMGDGVAFLPDTGKIVSPIKGSVTMIYPSGHAVGITSDSGVEILIHFGLNTFRIVEEVMRPQVEVGQVVEIGTPLINVDLEYFKANNLDTITSVVFTSGEKILVLKPHSQVSTSELNIIKIV